MNLEDLLKEMTFLMGEIQLLTKIRNLKKPTKDWEYENLRGTYNCRLESITLFFRGNINIQQSKKLKELEKKYPIEVMFLKLHDKDLKEFVSSLKK